MILLILRFFERTINHTALLFRVLSVPLVLASCCHLFIKEQVNKLKTVPHLSQMTCSSTITPKRKKTKLNISAADLIQLQPTKNAAVTYVFLGWGTCISCMHAHHIEAQEVVALV